jgi:hypothetical protein
MVVLGTVLEEPKKKRRTKKQVALEEALPEINAAFAVPVEELPVVKAKSPIELWLELAPEAIMDLTQRWYGEEFVPKYQKWLREGRLLAQQQT